MPNQTKPDTRILTPDEVDDIVSRKPTYGFGLIVGLTPAERDALGETVRAAWQQYEGAVSDFAAEINSLRAQLAQVEQERDLAYADGYSNGIRHGKQSRAPVAVTSIVIDREEAAKMAFEAVRSVLQSDWAERYSVLQIAGMVAANIRRFSPAVAATVNDEGEQRREAVRLAEAVMLVLGNPGISAQTWDKLVEVCAPAPPAQRARDAAEETRVIEQAWAKGGYMHNPSDFVIFAAGYRAALHATPSPTDNEEAK